jgi:NAD+ kinase
VKIAVVANPRKTGAIDFARRAVERIGSRAEVVLTEETTNAGPGLPHGPLEELRPDLQIAIGGDGTFLNAMRRCQAPLLPINAGTVGVLAEVEAHRPAEFEAAIDRLLGGLYYLEWRMKLGAQIGAGPLPDAVNEYVLHAAQVGKMGLFELAIDDRVVGRVQADGVIVASATGSTGYSLSSFGPVVDPAVDAIVLTTIAPFRVESRALVLDPLRTVRLRSVEPDRAAVVIADGQEEYPLAGNAAVTVYRSPRRAALIRFGSRFFERLRGKRILPWTDEPSEGGTGRADLPPPP